MATTNLATRTANVVGRALAEVADGLGMADAGLILPVGVGHLGPRPAARRGAVHQHADPRRLRRRGQRAVGRLADDG
jgi:hypothetical protein